jgi:hypothetical protein
VSGSQNGVGVKKHTTAEVAATALERNDVGELASGSSSATDNLVGAELRLGQSAGYAKQRNKGDEGDHLEGWGLEDLEWECGGRMIVGGDDRIRD